ncbi:MAG: type II secretion system major pseudopilin GspG [Pirellulaceae bacterium]|nr:type II secretion system major pseudopilin GspG [Pirellulaceae bacterium]
MSCLRNPVVHPIISASRRVRAFSLVELIVVMVIIGMLAGLVAVRTRSYLVASKQNVAKAEIANIVKSLESFYADQGRYPTNDEGLEILTEPTSSFVDGFLPRIPKDPWKNPYQYVSPGREGAYEVMCLGADGKEGGEAADRDISSERIDDE